MPRSYSVSEICHKADINRSIFYSNFEDINFLSKHVVEHLWEDFLALYMKDFDNKKDRLSFIKLFNHIYEHQPLYKTYFKLSDFDPVIIGYDKEIAEMFFEMKYLDYHIEFFKNGLNAIIKKWLDTGCRETPEEMQQILHNEYRRDFSLFGEKQDSDI